MNINGQRSEKVVFPVWVVAGCDVASVLVHVNVWLYGRAHLSSNSLSPLGGAATRNNVDSTRSASLLGNVCACACVPGSWPVPTVPRQPEPGSVTDLALVCGIPPFFPLNNRSPNTKPNIWLQIMRMTILWQTESFFFFPFSCFHSGTFTHRHTHNTHRKQEDFLRVSHLLPAQKEWPSESSGRLKLAHLGKWNISDPPETSLQPFACLWITLTQRVAELPLPPRADESQKCFKLTKLECGSAQTNTASSKHGPHVCLCELPTFHLHPGTIRHQIVNEHERSK